MLDKETATSLYRDTVNASNAIGENNDCTVRALTIVTGLPYTVCHEALRIAGRKRGKGCNWGVQWPALDSLGYVAYKLRDHVDSKTCVTLERELRKRFPDGRFLIGVNGHRLPYREGHIIDHAQGSRRRINTVYMIFKKTDPQPTGYEFERTRLVSAFETTAEPLRNNLKTAEPNNLKTAEPQPEPMPAPLTRKPRSRKLRRMTTKIRATGAEHPITTARQAYGLSTNQLGKLISAPGASLWRIERGLNVPRREVARDVFSFFQGALPLGAIYDGAYWLDTTPDDERARVLGRLEILGSEYRGHQTNAA